MPRDGSISSRVHPLLERSYIPKILFAAAVDGQQQAGARQRGEIVRQLNHAAGVVQLRGHPRPNPAALQDLAQLHRPWVADQSVGLSFDPKRPVVTMSDKL